MKNYISLTTTFLKTKAGMWTIAAVIVVVVGGYFILKPKTKTFDTVTITPKEFVQTVSVTGNVVPVQSANLAFETSARIAAVYKNVGDKVYQGEVIATLDSADIQANILKAQSDLEGARAKALSVSFNTGSGSSVESLDLLNAKKSAVDAVRNAFTLSDDAVRNKVDQMYSDPRNSNAKIKFAFDNYALFVDLNTSRVNMEYTLNDWSLWVNSVTAESFTVNDLEKSRTNLNVVLNFLNKVSLAVNSFEVNSSLSQTTIDSYKASVATARTNINTALSAISSAESNFTSTQSNTAVEQASVKSAEAVVAQYQAQLNKTIMRAPFNGSVTVQNAKVGQIASPGSVLVSVISSDAYEIDAFIPEADIAKVTVGDVADVTLDAYGSDVHFAAVVAQIDPAETLVSGVSTYKTVLHFTSIDERIKSGMTANTDITTEKKEGAFIVPQRVVVTKEDGKYVTVVTDTKTKATETRKVTTGKIDQNGDIEITSGLSVGDVVVTTLAALK